jgi:predicted SprT family Zn-dependent metalloprotease
MRNAARKQSPFSQLEFFFDAPVISQLPSARELQDRARSLLRALDAGILTDRVRVEWNERMRTTVGRADFRRCLISLNPALQEFGPAEIDRTLRHELGHLLAHFCFGRRRIQPHGREWRDACRELGISGERAGHTLPLVGRSLSRRFIYCCRNCQGRFPRARRIRRAIACLACCRKFSEGNYDERFRLQLVKGSSSGNSSALLANSPQ